MAGVAPSPATTLNLPANNATATDFVSTNVSSAFINSHTTDGKFVYPITVNLAGSAYLMANLGYSSLSNAFTFTIKRVSTFIREGHISVISLTKDLS